MLAPPRPPPPIDLTQLKAKILGRQAGMHWYTLIIEPQSWKRVGERAWKMGYGTYCPMSRVPAPKHTSGRAIFSPLMSGYLFVDMPGPRRRFDLFVPSDDPGERPEELPRGDLRGYVADCARPSVEPVAGCRGFITIDGSPVALHEAVIDDMRVRERNGEFDFTALDALPKWATMGRRVELSSGPFEGKFARILQTAKVGLVKILVFLFGQEMPIDVPISWLRPA